MHKNVFFFFTSLSIFIQNNLLGMDYIAQTQKVRQAISEKNKDLFTATWNYCSQQARYNHVMSNLKKDNNSLFTATWNYSTQQLRYNHVIGITVGLQYRKNSQILETYDKDCKKLIDIVFNCKSNEETYINYKPGKLFTENEFVILQKPLCIKKPSEHLHYLTREVIHVYTEIIFVIQQNRFSNKQGFKHARDLVHKIEQEMLNRSVQVKLNWQSFHSSRNPDLPVL